MTFLEVTWEEYGTNIRNPAKLKAKARQGLCFPQVYYGLLVSVCLFTTIFQYLCQFMMSVQPYGFTQHIGPTRLLRLWNLAMARDGIGLRLNPLGPVPLKKYFWSACTKLSTWDLPLEHGCRETVETYHPESFNRHKTQFGFPCNH